MEKRALRLRLQNRRFSGGGTTLWPDKLPVLQARVTPLGRGDSDSSIVNQNTNNETLTRYFESE